jgi:putative flavoprotein involved in K+ transport
MRHIDTVIIGGGQAGLAMSRCLSDRGVEHVVLERGRVGERWRSERWDSLRLLTPRWQSRLPGFTYDGPDPDGYMSRVEVIDYLERYARSFPAPVHAGVTVESVERDLAGYRVRTDAGGWRAEHVVIATGECDTPFVPKIAHSIDRAIEQIVPTRYRNPGHLRDGGVLVVGASSTGIQLALEIHRSGRPVMLSVARHTRLPRTYRGRDILWWLDRTGIMSERARDAADLAASRNQPSMQLIGTRDRTTIDLGVLHDEGIRIVGSTSGIDGTRIDFEDDLLETTIAADLKLARLRLRIDNHIRAHRLENLAGPEEPFDAMRLPDADTRIDLKAERIDTVVWATGFRRRYPWLRVPVLDRRGEIIHDEGITPADGLYVMGLQFMRRRNSSFIDGVARDAAELSEHLCEGRRGCRDAA